MQSGSQWKRKRTNKHTFIFLIITNQHAKIMNLRKEMPFEKFMFCLRLFEWGRIQDSFSKELLLHPLI